MIRNRFASPPLTGPKVTAVLFAAILLAVAGGLTSGCTALHVRGEMATMIPAKAIAAGTIVEAAKGGTLTESAARDYLSGDGLVLATYDQAMTVNAFAYVFGGKTILVTAKAYNALHAVAQDAAACAKRATSCPADDARAQAAAEAQAILYVDQLRRGIK
jgi:hypothetical protein